MIRDRAGTNDKLKAYNTGPQTRHPDGVAFIGSSIKVANAGRKIGVSPNNTVSVPDRLANKLITNVRNPRPTGIHFHARQEASTPK